MGGRRYTAGDRGSVVRCDPDALIPSAECPAVPETLLREIQGRRNSPASRKKRLVLIILCITYKMSITPVDRMQVSHKRKEFFFDMAYNF